MTDRKLSERQLQKLYREPGEWDAKIKKWHADRKASGCVTGRQLKQIKGYKAKMLEAQMALASALRDPRYKGRLMAIRIKDTV